MSPRPTHLPLILLALSLASCAPFASAAMPVTPLFTEASQSQWWKRWAK